LEALYPTLTAALNVRRDVTARSSLLIDAEAFERSGAALNAALAALERARQESILPDDAHAKRLTLSAPPTNKEIQWGRVREQFASASALSRTLVQLAGQICDDFNLTLDPEIETFYRMDWVCFAGPAMMVHGSTVRDLTTLALSADQLGPATVRELILAQAGLRASTERARVAAAKAAGGLMAGGEAEMPTHQRRWWTAQQQLIDQLDELVFNVASPSELEVNPAMRRVGDAELQTQHEMTDEMLQLLDERLRERIHRLRTIFYTVLLVTVLVLTLLGYLLACYVRMLRRSVLQLSQHIKLMAQRDLTQVPAVWSGHDELVAISADLRALHEEWQMQLRLLQRVADRLRNEHEEAARQAHGLSPALVRLLAESLRDLAQQLHAALQRFRLK
jgi:hypothetical protein